MDPDRLTGEHQPGKPRMDLAHARGLVPAIAAHQCVADPTQGRQTMQDGPRVAGALRKARVCMQRIHVTHQAVDQCLVVTRR